ncbi:MAG TPA: hypothetical protein VD772_03575, partial [Anseongella sp.]|nr:hypothetical protein [Anseongella sp.]
AWSYKSEPRRYQLTWPQNGRAARAFGSLREMEQESTPLPKTQVFFPEKIKLEEEWLGRLPPGTLPQADLLPAGKGHVLAFYTRSADEKMNHHILVMDRHGETLHKDLLAEGILHPAMDTFFVVGEQLCYIKRKSEILAYFL